LNRDTLGGAVRVFIYIRPFSPRPLTAFCVAVLEVVKPLFSSLSAVQFPLVVSTRGDFHASIPEKWRCLKSLGVYDVVTLKSYGFLFKRMKKHNEKAKKEKFMDWLLALDIDYAGKTL